MNEKLNKLKKTVKDHKTEAIAITVAVVAVGVAVFVIRKEHVLSPQPYLRIRDKQMRGLVAGTHQVRFDTKFGPLVLRGLPQD